MALTPQVSLFASYPLVDLCSNCAFFCILLQDNMSRSDDPNDYVVHDPLLEKGKEKFNKMQARQKRREREWAGKSLT